MRAPRLLHDDEVVIIHRTEDGIDEDGVPITVQKRFRWPRVNIQRTSAEELTDQGRNTTATIYRVTGAHPPVPIEAGARIQWRGDTYEVDGEPETRTGRARVNYTALHMIHTQG